MKRELTAAQQRAMAKYIAEKKKNCSLSYMRDNVKYVASVGEDRP